MAFFVFDAIKILQQIRRRTKHWKWICQIIIPLIIFFLCDVQIISDEPFKIQLKKCWCSHVAHIFTLSLNLHYNRNILTAKIVFIVWTTSAFSVQIPHFFLVLIDVKAQNIYLQVHSIHPLVPHVLVKCNISFRK